MRRFLFASALAVAGLFGTTGTASAFWPNCGPYYTSAAFPLVNPPGYYTNLYSYGWMYPWFSGYNYSSSPYYGWWQTGGFATYRVCNPNPLACPIPGYVGGPHYAGPPFVPGCRNESTHAGGPNGIWLNYGADGYPAAGAPVPAPAVTTPAPAPVVPPAPVLPGVPAPNGKVSITLPSDARLSFNGTFAAGNGTVRTFQTPPLEPGTDYTYTLSAEVIVDGTVRTVSEKVIVRAGEETKVTLAAK